MDKKTMDENVFNFIYVAAMRDAVLQKAFKGKKKWLYEPNDLKKWSDYIREFTDKVLTGKFKKQNDYNDAFLKTAKQVCDIINLKIKERNESGSFTFGNAQKLLNIMLKYFYITCYGDNNKKRDNFRFCHCPMDQIMLEKVWEACKCETKKRCSRQCRDTCQYGLRTISEMQCYEAKGIFTDSWGNEDFKNGGYPDRYLAFQAAVKALADKENCYPIEYDYSVWGNQADGE